MNHEPFEELLALRSYGELSPAEERELDRHLARCAACTRLAAEGQTGLARLRAAKHTVDELDLVPRLRAALAAEPRRASWSPWLTVAASFAAGIVVATLLARAPRSSNPSGSIKASTTWERFHTDDAPPLASSGGSLGRLSAYIAR